MEIKKEINKILKNTNIKQIATVLNGKAQIDLKAQLIEKTSFLDSNVKITERIYCILNNITEIIYCTECKNKKVKFERYGDGYNKFCSRHCAWINKDLHKHKDITIKKKYLVNNISQLESVKEIKRNINIKTYGVDNIFKSDYFKSRKQISIKTNRWFKYNNFIKNIEKSFTHNILEWEFEEKGTCWPYTLICKRCNSERIHMTETNYGTNYVVSCFYCNKNLFTSQPEKDLNTYILSIDNNINILQNNRKILKGKELDLYLPEYNLAIEYNWLMFHSIWINKASMFNNHLLEKNIRNNHLYKTEECENQWIQLLHIFENERLNENKQQIWKNIIKTKLGKNKKIYGRNTYIKDIDNNTELKIFLEKYHLQWNIGSKYKIWLYSKENNELLSLMTFWQWRYWKANWELLRFVSRWWISIIWWASKIFKYFVNNYMKKGEIIKTYADRRFSDWKLYRKLWFQLKNISKPNYFYFKANSYQLESRIKYQKHKLKDKLEIFDESLTESENMYNNDYRKIYDCWNYVFEYIKE